MAYDLGSARRLDCDLGPTFLVGYPLRVSDAGSLRGSIRFFLVRGCRSLARKSGSQRSGQLSGIRISVGRISGESRRDYLV